MKPVQVNPLFMMILTVVFAISASAWTPARADNEGLVVEVSLSGDRAMLGEPIVLTYKFINRSQEPVRAVLGKSLMEWLKMTMRDKDGRIISPLPNHRPLGAIEIRVPSPWIELAPGASEEGQLVLNQRFAIPSPGEYQVSFQARIPYTSGQSPQEVVFTAERSLTLTVTAPSPIRLRRMAEVLGKEALKEQHVARKWLAMDKLFSMPEAVALPAWQALVRNPNAECSYIIGHLARIGSPNALRLIAEVAADRSRGIESQVAAQGILRAMFLQETDPRLKAHLGRLLVALDGDVPYIKNPLHP